MPNNIYHFSVIVFCIGHILFILLNRVTMRSVEMIWYSVFIKLKGIHISQSKTVEKIQPSMQLSHLSIIFENIWSLFISPSWMLNCNQNIDSLFIVYWLQTSTCRNNIKVYMLKTMLEQNRSESLTRDVRVLCKQNKY